MQGIETVDQIVEGKVAMTKVTEPDDWVVFNDDELRVGCERPSLVFYAVSFDALTLRESLSAHRRNPRRKHSSAAAR